MPTDIIVKFADLAITDDALAKSVVDVLKSGKFIKAKQNERFAELWAARCGAKYCVPTSSGSAALISVLRSLKINGLHGKYVIVPAYSFAATAFAVIEAGYIPVFCDVLDNGLINQDKCLELIKVIGSEDLAAIMIVHLYGQHITINRELLEYPVVEDACQAHGVIKKVQGLAACFSFYPTKNLGAAGDAGALVTNNQLIAATSEAYVNYGDYPNEKYIHSMQGNNLRMSEIQAAVLAYKLELDYLSRDNAKRMQLAKMYMDNGLVSVNYSQGIPNAWHLFPILVDQPDQFRKLLSSYGIETGRHYPYTLHQVCKSSAKIFSCDDHMTANKLANYVVTLPLGPHMAMQDADYVSNIAQHNISYDSSLKLYELDIPSPIRRVNART